jgi:hypothetical protein
LVRMSIFVSGCLENPIFIMPCLESWPRLVNCMTYTYPAIVIYPFSVATYLVSGQTSSLVMSVKVG